MYQYHRKWIAALLMTCMANSAFAAMDAPTIKLQKRQVVQDVLHKLTISDQENAVMARVADAHALLNFNWKREDNVPVLQIEVTRIPQCNTFSLDDGKRLVIDLENTINLRAGMVLELDEQSIITGARTSLFAYRPKFISRIALDLEEPFQFRVDSHESRIVVYLTPKNLYNDFLRLGEINQDALRIEIIEAAPVPKPEPQRLAYNPDTSDLVNKLFGQLTTLAYRTPAEGETIGKTQKGNVTKKELPRQRHTPKKIVMTR